MRNILGATALAVAFAVAAGCHSGSSHHSSGGGGGAGAPSITALAPTNGHVGDTLLITGANFPTATAALVTFTPFAPTAYVPGAITVTAVTETASTVTVTVPSGCFPGTYDVSVQASATGTASNAEPFTVTLPARVYVFNNETAGNERISVLAVTTTAGTGAVTLTALASADTGVASNDFEPDAQGIRIDAAARRLYAAVGDSLVVFDIAGDTGELSLDAAATASPVDTGIEVYGLALNAARTEAYVSDFVDNATNGPVYAIALSRTATTVTAPVSGTSTSLAVPVLARGDKFLFVSSENDSTVVGFSIASSGTLTALAGSPFTITSTGNSAVTLYGSPDGSRLYAPIGGDNDIVAFNVDPTSGTLTAVATSPFALTSAAVMAFSPDGSHAFVAPSVVTTTVYVLDVGADGTLTPSAETSTATTAAKRFAMTVSADGKLLFATNVAGSVTVFSIASGTGALTELSTVPLTFSTSTNGPNAIATTR